MKAYIYATLIGVILFSGLLFSNHGGTSEREFPSLVLPSGKPVYIRHAWETRIRPIVFYGKDRLLIAGFTMNPEKKEKGFIRLLPEIN